jgi:hypothetical protein
MEELGNEALQQLQGAAARFDERISALEKRSSRPRKPNT